MSWVNSVLRQFLANGPKNNCRLVLDAVNIRTGTVFIVFMVVPVHSSSLARKESTKHKAGKSDDRKTESKSQADSLVRKKGS